MKTKKSLFLILAVSFLVLAGCGKQASDQADEGSKEKLSVVATNSILADMAKEVGTDQIDIHSIVPVGTDPHEYEVLPEDIKKASDADVILYNGLNLETGNSWFDNLMETAKKEEGKDYFAVSKNVEPLYLTSGEEHTKADPHAWLDLSNGIKYRRKSHVYSLKKMQKMRHSIKKCRSICGKTKRIRYTSEGKFCFYRREQKIISNK